MAAGAPRTGVVATMAMDELDPPRSLFRSSGANSGVTGMMSAAHSSSSSSASTLPQGGGHATELSGLTGAIGGLGALGVGSGGGVARRRVGIVDRSLGVAVGKEVNAAAYALLVSEMVQYCRNRVMSVTDLERKLGELGERIGRRSLELVTVRDKLTRRETKILGILNFVVTTQWKYLFGKQPDSLKKSTDTKYYIEEAEPLINRYISVPKDYGTLNCSAFVGGMIQGIITGAGFPCVVTVDYISSNDRQVTVYVIEFDQAVLDRERRVA